jgi:hypothetical protein
MDQDRGTVTTMERKGRKLRLKWVAVAVALSVIAIVAAVLFATRHHGSTGAAAATPAQFAALHTGMTPAAVRNVLGKTSRKCWDYGPSASADEVCFDNGRVVSTHRGRGSTRLKGVSAGMRGEAILKQIGTPQRKCWLYGPAKTPDRLCFLNGQLASKSRG